MNEPKPIERAVDMVGGQTALANRLGVKQAHVWNWINRDNKVPAEHCRAIAEATGQIVTVHDLRPDVFGPSQFREQIA